MDDLYAQQLLNVLERIANSLEKIERLESLEYIGQKIASHLDDMDTRLHKISQK